MEPDIARDEDIDLNEVLKVIWNSKLLLFLSSSIFFVGAVVYSLSLPNIYRSEALLSPTSQENTMSSTARTYGGIASLAGINLVAQNNQSNHVKALDKLNSLSFFSDSILPNIFLPNLMAIKSWNPETNTIIYDENIYSKKTQKWVRESQYPQSQIPSAQESFIVFQDHVDISRDIDTGFITIAVKHQSPFIAQAWTKLIVKELNYFFRVKDKAETKAARDYLYTQIEQTSFAEIKQVIAELIQQKTQQLTLIEVSDYYVFEYIDPPAVMEIKHEPNRLGLALIGAFLGLIFGLIVIIFKNLISSNSPNLKG